MTKLGTLHGLVLAGGRSSRMGTDKTRLLWQGKPLFRHMAELLSNTGIRQVMISGQGFTGENSVADIIPQRGPLSGIHAALQRLPSGDRLLVCPVDMPLLPLVAIRLLGMQSVLCCFEGFTLPLLLPVNASARTAIDRAIHSDNTKDYALWRLYQQLDGQTIPLPQAMTDYFENANTPEDWRHLMTKHF